MAWTLEIPKRIKKDLKRLDKQIAKQIVRYITEDIARDPENIGEKLKHRKDNLHSAHFSNKYRVLYSFDVEKRTIQIAKVGHRRIAYDRI